MFLTHCYQSPRIGFFERLGRPEDLERPEEVSPDAADRTGVRVLQAQLAHEAGASGFFSRKGWLKVFRTERERDKRFAEAERWRSEFGVNYRTLDSQALLPAVFCQM